MSAKRNATSWRPGRSGNPAGRPAGLGWAGKLRAGIGESLPGIVAKLTEQAKAGDTQAARTLLDVALPKLRPESLREPLPLPAGGSLSETGQAILVALAGGRIGIHEAAALLGAIGAHAKALETLELQARVSRVESILDARERGHDHAG
jgi:hypothetical protein